MATLITPIMIEAPTTTALHEAGYETRVVGIDLTDEQADDSDLAEQVIAAWEPLRPDGDGWLLHHKGWIGEHGDAGAIWARPQPR